MVSAMFMVMVKVKVKAMVKFKGRSKAKVGVKVMVKEFISMIAERALLLGNIYVRHKLSASGFGLWGVGYAMSISDMRMRSVPGAWYMAVSQSGKLQTIKSISKCNDDIV